MLTKWIIAIGNTEADGVRMLYTIGSVDQIKRALVELALEDKSNDEESSAVRFSQREEHLLEVP